MGLLVRREDGRAFNAGEDDREAGADDDGREAKGTRVPLEKKGE